MRIQEEQFNSRVKKGIAILAFPFKVLRETLDNSSKKNGFKTIAFHTVSLYE